MLRKRARSLQKDQHKMDHITISDANSDNYSQSHHHALGRNIKGNSIFKVPCLFVGLDPKGLLDSDSVRSPTSPLDARFLSNLGNPHRNPRPIIHEGTQRSWDCCKVGLSIVESLEDCSKLSGKILSSPESKNSNLSPEMMIKTPFCTKTYRDSFETSKSLPKDFCKVPYPQKGSLIPKGEPTVVFEIGETGLERSFSLDSCSPLKTISGLTASNSDSVTDNNFSVKDKATQLSSPPNFIGGSQNSNIVSIFSSNEFIESLSASEIEQSEDYTCVITHGPNPKTTHIFGDCILETHPNGFKNHFKHEVKEMPVTLVGNSLQSPLTYPSSVFLSFCHHCNKKLDEGKDIYIYGGEKAFCSLACRAMVIMMDEELEKSKPPCENSPKGKLGDQIFETGILTET